MSVIREFSDLTIYQKREMLGKIQHLIQTNEQYFYLFRGIIRDADEYGLFKGIEFKPKENEYKKTDNLDAEPAVKVNQSLSGA